MNHTARLRYFFYTVILYKLLKVAYSHSWVDCIDHSYDVVYTNSVAWVLTGTRGNGICEGYGYDFPGRGDPDVNVKFTYKLLPDEIRANQKPVCQTTSDQADYTGWRTRIHAKPGDTLYFAYFANGHTAIDKRGSGTLYGLYWSQKPNVMLNSPLDLKLENLVDGQLHNFDDGNCGEAFDKDGKPTGRAGAYLPCVGKFRVPSNVASGTYPMVWYWTFFNETDFNGNFTDFQGAGGAAYSTCFDMVVEGGASNVLTGTVENVISDTVASVISGTLGSSNPSKVTSMLPTNVPTSIRSESPSGTPLTVPPRVPSTIPVSVPLIVPTTAPEIESLGSSPSVPERVPFVPPSALPSAPSTVPASVIDGKFGSQQENVVKITAPKPYDAYKTRAASYRSRKKASRHNVTTTSVPAQNNSPPLSSNPRPIAPVFPVSPTLSPSASQNVPIYPSQSVTYSSIGGPGTYSKILNLSCVSSQYQCIKSDYHTNAPLAPFHEDLTLALRGPLSIRSISAFTHSSDTNAFILASYFTPQSPAQNMIFLNNRGDNVQSGLWDICHGNSQSYATSDGTSAARESVQFNGNLADNVEINVMTSSLCSNATCGFSRGVSYRGWSGGNKIFMIQASMPHTQGKDMPAIWLLNGQVVRTAQYGCNCRNQGISNKHKGGCGELDIAEVVEGDLDAITSTIYSFQGAKSANHYVTRPTDRFQTNVVVFDAAASEIHVFVFQENEIDVTLPPTPEQIDMWKQVRGLKLSLNV